MNLTTIQQKIDQLSQEHEAEMKRHKATIARIVSMQDTLIRLRDQTAFGSGVLGRTARGRELIEIHGYGQYGHHPMAQTALAAAVSDIAQCRFEIRHNYFGMGRHANGAPFRIDRPYDQEVYEGPPCFEVGLTQLGFRTEFTPEDIEAMIYYLVRHII